MKTRGLSHLVYRRTLFRCQSTFTRMFAWDMDTSLGTGRASKSVRILVSALGHKTNSVDTSVGDFHRGVTDVQFVRIR